MGARSESALRQTLGALVIGGLFLLSFWPTLRWMAERFSAADSFYSHGWLIPAASGWLIWQRRHRLAQLPPQPSFWGLALLVPSLVVHLAATVWTIQFVSGFAMLGASWGMLWTMCGWRWLWAVRFPMLFLLFMVPLPGVLLIATSFRMKLMAATAATQCIRWLGIAAHQAGSTIQLPGMAVVVDDTCSGLRSLISLVGLAVLWTSLMPPIARRWHKLAMVASSVPIALVANIVRIVILVLLAAVYGHEAAEGFLHYGSGVVVFGVAMALLMGVSHRLISPRVAAGHA